ncbi:MAG: tetratricopeptide repeat protein [Burkholderiales bacterium]|nr:tetratricopeptide repeat protein [Burkholderiales bacterium]
MPFPLSFMFRKRATPDAHALLREASRLYETGVLGDAAHTLGRIVQCDPDNFEALHMLGLVASAQGRHQEAEALFARALKGDPNSIAAHFNRGVTLRILGREKDAVDSFDRAIAGNPQFVAALAERGGALLALGQPEDAVRSYEGALAIESANLDVLSNLGRALVVLGRSADALGAFDRALALRPDSPALICERASALTHQHRHQEALAEYEHAISLDPRHVDAMINRANLLRGMGRIHDAIAGYERILEMAPNLAQVWYSLGHILHSSGRSEDAILAYERALDDDPNHVGALHNLGILQSEERRFDRSAECYQRILAVAPGYPHADGNLADARAQICDWRDRPQLIERVEDGVRRGHPACVPFVLLGLTDDRAMQAACAATHVADRHPPCGALWRGETYRHDRIRVAYVSADFREHAVAFLMAGLLEQHDRARFEVTAISFGARLRSQMRDRIEAACERFVDVSTYGDAAIAELIRAQEIDIAVDLMGHTGSSRLGIFARRPAPVQVNYLGYPGTSGASYMDYIVGDPFVIPDAHRRGYSEKVVWLPDSFQVNDSRRPRAAQVPSRGESGLPPEGFVFCCFNNSYKITPQFFDIWMRLLREVPGSVMWLVGGDPILEVNLRRAATSRNVEPARLVFASRSSYATHLARLRQADLFLDTLPFNAGTTASDALWAGVPVLTCAGSAFASRMAGSLVRAAGVPEFVTHSPDEYEALALRMACDPSLLTEARARLGVNNENLRLFDTERFCRHLEIAYAQMHDLASMGEAPRDLAIDSAPVGQNAYLPTASE